MGNKNQQANGCFGDDLFIWMEHKNFELRTFLVQESNYLVLASTMYFLNAYYNVSSMTIRICFEITMFINYKRITSFTVCMYAHMTKKIN